MFHHELLARGSRVLTNGWIHSSSMTISVHLFIRSVIQKIAIMTIKWYKALNVICPKPSPHRPLNMPLLLTAGQSGSQERRLRQRRCTLPCHSKAPKCKSTRQQSLTASRGGSSFWLSHRKWDPSRPMHPATMSSHFQRSTRNTCQNSTTNHYESCHKHPSPWTSIRTHAREATIYCWGKVSEPVTYLNRIIGSLITLAVVDPP